MTSKKNGNQQWIAWMAMTFILLLGLPSTAATGPVRDPTAFWAFEEGTGLIASDVMDGHHGMVAGPLWTLGVEGNALVFDGGDDYVEVPHHESLNFVESLTATAWVRRTDILDNQYASILRKSGGVYQLFSADQENRPFFGDANGWVRTLHPIVIPGRWTFLAAAAEGAEVRIYANVRPEPIYTIGDSITAGHGGPESHCTAEDNCGFSQGRNIEHTYQYWLDQFLGSYASAESVSASYYNKGHGSQTCDQVLARFDSDIPDDAEVILMCGINDFALGSDHLEVEADILDIYDLAMTKSNNLAVMEITPDGNGLYCENITAFNTWLADFAAAHEYVSIVHVHDALSSGTPCFYDPALYESDRVHPNEDGLRALAFEIWNQAYDNETAGLAEQLTEPYASWDGIDQTSAGSLFLGLREDLAGYPLKGLIDEVGIFDTALEESEILERYNQVSTDHGLHDRPTPLLGGRPAGRQIVNGGFETGSLAPWENPEEIPEKWAVTDTLAHGGQNAARTTTGDAGGIHALSQRFDPPIAVTEDCTLRYWYHATSEETTNLAVGFQFSDGSYDQDFIRGASLDSWILQDVSETLWRHPGTSIEALYFFDTLETDLRIDDVLFQCAQPAWSTVRPANASSCGEEGKGAPVANLLALFLFPAGAALAMKYLRKRVPSSGGV